MNIGIYTKTDCVWCVRAKELLAQKGLNYTEYKLGTDFTVDEFKEIFPNRRTLPQVIIDGNKIGGFEELRLYGI